MGRIVVNDVMRTPWSATFLRLLGQSPRSAQALERLERLGIERRLLFRFLHSYTEPARIERRRRFRAAVGKLAVDIGKLARRVEQMRAIIERVQDDLDMNIPTHLQNHREAEVISALEAAYSQLTALRNDYKRVANQRGKLRDEEQLISVMLTTRAKTGQPHWEDMAYLLTVASAAHHVREEFDAQSLRAIVKRYKKQNPSLYEATERLYLQSPENQ